MTVETRRPRRRWLVLTLILAAVLGLAFVAFQLLDSASPIDYYRVVDDGTVAVGTVSGSEGRVPFREPSRPTLIS